MARPASATINCPNCGQPFGAFLEQILDTRVDPTVKERLLSGRINTINCPNCGYRGAIGTPVVYHDHAKQLAIIHVPMELNLGTEQRERIVGDMTQALMRSLPEDSPKGYLLQPRTALTMQGLIEQVLEAEGITQDILNLQRRKLDLIQSLITTEDSTERDQLLAENGELIDVEFISLLQMTAQQMQQAGESRPSLRLLNIRARLLETTEAGQLIRQQELAIREASDELRALGEGITREKFVDLLVQAASNEAKVEALGQLARPLLDYTTFQLITQKVEAASGDEKTQLAAVRDRLLAINAEYEQQSRAVIERATDTLKMLIQAPDIPAAIRNNLDRIDETFLQVLQANLEEARRSGNVEISRRMREIRDVVLDLIQQSAPPEVQFINDLLSIEAEADAIAQLEARRGEVTPELLDMMQGLIGQLESAGNQEAAARLAALQQHAGRLIAS